MNVLDENIIAPITHLIPVKNDNGANLGMSWGSGNVFAVFELPSKKDGATLNGSNLFEIKWDAFLKSSVSRKLVNESYGIFMSLQRLQGDPSSIRPQLVKISHNYRSVIKCCVENLKSTAETCDLKWKCEVNKQSEVFYKAELIWNLCEILFINIQPGGVIMTQLLDWIQWHFTDHKVDLQNILNHLNPASHPDFWNTLYSHVLQGQMNEARKLIRLHPDIHSDHFQSMDELLRKMPLYSSYSGHSLTEFNLRWKQWQDECQRRYEEGEFLLDENLVFLAQILSGVKEAFVKLRPIVKTWYHFMVSYLLYTNPSFKGHELHQLAEECIEVYDGMHNMSHLDNILLSAIEFDLQQVIKGCYGCLDQWFVAHLTDLLFHCGETHSDKFSHGPLLRESLLLDYAASLMSHNSLWQIGVDYFDTCTISGRYYLEFQLERIPLKSYHKALKVYNIAVEREMTDLAHSICKSMGRKSIEQGRLGSALTWAIKSKDSGFTSYLADRILKDYAQTGQFSSLDILDNLGSCMLVSDRLTFLGKYREFHKLNECKDLQAAANLLISLLTSQIAPKYFWLVLLLDALPLLGNEEPIFTSSQTQELIYCLEELLSNWKSSKFQFDHKLLKDKEEIIRIALSHNLARTFIKEGTDFTL